MATIEGRNPVIEAIKNDREIDKIMIANSAKEGSIKKIIGMAKEKNIVIQYVDKHKLDEVSTSHSHQGVIAQVSEYKYWELDELIESVKAKNEDPFFVILDEITDPHNLGSIIRTADAVGAHGVIIPKRRSVTYLLPVLCLNISYNRIPAATEAFNDVTFPIIGILTVKSQFCLTNLDIPNPSLPITNPSAPVRFCS